MATAPRPAPSFASSPRSNETIRVYTPHGGSLHYPLNTIKGALYSRLERALMNATELFLFESAFARDTYQRTIGTPQGLVRCVFNGVTADEFDPVVKAADATDIVYVGEFRHIKGADLLIDAVARLHADGKPVTLTLAGDGEEMAALKAQVAAARSRPRRCASSATSRRATAFPRAALLVVPSRGDSMPYVVIEAAAAGIPMVAANVGGIPGDFRLPYRRAVCAQHRRRDGGRDRDRAGGSRRPRWRAQSRCASGSSCIFRRRRWSKACWRATATRLPIVNHSLPAITVSSELSAKP